MNDKYKGLSIFWENFALLITALGKGGCYGMGLYIIALVLHIHVWIIVFIVATVSIVMDVAQYIYVRCRMRGNTDD